MCSFTASGRSVPPPAFNSNAFSKECLPNQSVGRARAISTFTSLTVTQPRPRNNAPPHHLDICQHPTLAFSLHEPQSPRIALNHSTNREPSLEHRVLALALSLAPL
eukprot:6178875-Pleurochrysis_carterae.AAC.2